MDDGCGFDEVFKDKIAEKEARRQPALGKEFVSGEGFPYLVRSYRLLLGVEPKAVEVRVLGSRWRSCRQVGGINFHWITILLLVSVVDYIIVHELAHLMEPNHTPEFWRRVGQALPEYEQHKTWVPEQGATCGVESLQRLLNAIHGQLRIGSRQAGLVAKLPIATSMTRPRRFDKTDSSPLEFPEC